MLSTRLQRLRGSGAASVFRAAHPANLKRKASNSWSAVQDTYLSTKDVFERHRVVFTICTSVGSLLTAWAAYYLNPKYHVTQQLGSRPELIRALEKVVSKLERDPRVQSECMRQVKWYRDQLGSFGRPSAIAALENTAPGYTLRHLHQSKVEKRLESIEQAMKDSHDVKHEEIKKIVTSGNVSTAACVATAWTSLVVGYGLGWRGGSWFANRKFRREQLKLMGQIKPHRWQFLKRPLIRSPITGAPPKPTDIASS